MLIHNSYGKSRVRLTKVNRNDPRHEIKELDVSVELQGDFLSSYTHGDNSKVIATDSMKNTVYVLARNHPVESAEGFGLTLARHFVSRYPQVERASIQIREQPWQRIEVGGQLHTHAFVSGGNEQRVCTVEFDRAGRETVASGIADLVVLKTTDSAFKQFVSDEFRTLLDADDRIFATSISATWNHSDVRTQWNTAFAAARTAILETFATHYSLAVQQTLLEMGNAVLAACPSVGTITIELPNQHRIPFNLQPFGLDNPNVVFIPTTEPFGLIKGTIERDKS